MNDVGHFSPRIRYLSVVSNEMRYLRIPVCSSFLNFLNLIGLIIHGKVELFPFMSDLRNNNGLHFIFIIRQRGILNPIDCPLR